MNLENESQPEGQQPCPTEHAGTQPPPATGHGTVLEADYILQKELWE